PATDGRPDPRPTVRENVAILGNLVSEFDFTQAPRAPLVLPVHPQTTLTATVPFHPIKPTATAGTGSATLRWSWQTRSGNPGGSPITGYVIRPFRNGVAQPARTFSATGSTTSRVVSNLTRGASYTFKIAAVNAVGTGYDTAATRAVTIP
ncbi:MAG: large repetitive protein, partial [Actinomycetota bacterium]|nr:large repetitive protein [Actinomycetota bacterium]